MSYKLSDVATYISVKINTDDIALDEYVSTENMLPDKGGVTTASSLPSTAKTNSFVIGDVLFSNIRTYFRKVWFARFDGGVSNDVLVLRSIDTDILFDKYLYYLLSNEAFIQYTVTTAKGTKMPRGDKGAIMNYEFTLPPLTTQKKIAHILSTLDDKIEINRKMNQTLEEMAQALFKSWFVDFDPVHIKADAKSDEALEGAAVELGVSKEVLELFPSEFEESEMGMIPKGWEVQRFGDVVEKYIDNRGKTPPTVENGIPLLEVRNMPDDMLTSYPNVKKFVTEEIYDSWFRSHLEGNDILISTVGTIGKTCIMPSNTRIAIAQNVLGIRFKSDILDNQFMFFQMKSRRFLHAIDARLVITVQASIKRKDLNTIDIIVPPQSIQELFINQIKPIIVKQQSNENYNLKQMRDSLLPKLLSGEIDVSEVKI